MHLALCQSIKKSEFIKKMLAGLLGSPIIWVKNTSCYCL